MSEGQHLADAFERMFARYFAHWQIRIVAEDGGLTLTDTSPFKHHSAMASPQNQHRCKTNDNQVDETRLIRQHPTQIVLNIRGMRAGRQAEQREKYCFPHSPFPQSDDVDRQSCHGRISLMWGLCKSPLMNLTPFVDRRAVTENSLEWAYPQ